MTTLDRQILVRILAGKRHRQIALELGKCTKTINNHCIRIYRHHGVKGKLDLALKLLTNEKERAILLRAIQR